MTADNKKLISDVNSLVEEAIKRNLARLMGVDLAPSVRPPRTTAGLPLVFLQETDLSPNEGRILMILMKDVRAMLGV